MLGGLFGGGGNKAAKKAAREAERLGQEAVELNQDWQQQLKDMYSPYHDVGTTAYEKILGQMDNIRNDNIPEAFLHDNSQVSNLYNDYFDSIVMPEANNIDVPVNGPDYENAMNTDQYRALMDASANAVGSNAAYSGDIDPYAQVANQNTYDIAHREYQNDMMNYEQGLKDNMYRDQLNLDIANTGMGMEDYLYRTNQQNYQNQLTGYGHERDQLTNYLGQLGYLTNSGLNANNSLAGYGTGIMNSMTEGLTGQANSALSGAASQMQNEAQNFSSLAKLGQTFGNIGIKSGWFS